MTQISLESSMPKYAFFLVGNVLITILGNDSFSSGSRDLYDGLVSSTAMLLPTNGSDDRYFENISTPHADVRTDFFEKITRRKNSYATWNSYVPHFIISVHYGSKSTAFHKTMQAIF